MERGEGRGPGAVGPAGVEGGDLRRTGPSRTTIQDVPLGVGNATSDGNGATEIATIRYSFMRIESNRDGIDFRTILR